MKFNTLESVHRPDTGGVEVVRGDHADIGDHPHVPCDQGVVRVHHREAGVGLVIRHRRHVWDRGQVRPREAGHVSEAGGGEASDNSLCTAHQYVVLTNTQGRGAEN